jgi:hypothetical protein
MSFNGTGTFNINTGGQPVVTGTTISSTVFNALTADLGNGLTNTLTKDGQSTPTNNIKFGGFKLTGVGLATVTGDALSYGRNATVNDLAILGNVTLSSGINGTTINSTSIGATTPSTGAFTTLSASSTVSGAGFTAYFASPPAIGGTAAAAITGTTITGTTITANTRFVGAIDGTVGATTAAAGLFTTLGTSGVTTMGADGVFTAAYSPTSVRSIGYRGVPQVGGASKTASYTLVLADAGHHVYLTGSTASQTVTIPANGSVAFPIGTTISIVNGATVAWTVPITTDTLTLAGGTTTGTRTLAVGAVATIIKVTATAWYISGAGVS